MHTIIFLCVFIWSTNFVNSFLSTGKQSAQEENEERIIVRELASMIRNTREKLKNQHDQTDTDYEELPDFTKSEQNISDNLHSQDKNNHDEERGSESSFQRASQVESLPVSNTELRDAKKEPFAVPPSDIRYYQRDFTNDPSPLQAPLTANWIPTTLSSSTKKNLSNETEEEIQRRKLYAHLTLNPSFIPYGQVQSIRIPPAGYYYDDKNATNFLALTYGTVCAILVITTGTAYVFCRKYRKTVKDAEDVDYPAYGVTGPYKDAPVTTGDRHLARSAQMYHYQHQKQQITAMETSSSPTLMRKRTESGSEEDDLTVYECPGLAPVTGEMEVKNPIFQDDEEVKTHCILKETLNQKKLSDLEEKKSKK